MRQNVLLAPVECERQPEMSTEGVWKTRGYSVLAPGVLLCSPHARG
ncbi:hypothetical protein OCH7691_03105 [Oceanibacterium hippocampi]|uniref:Uncharacterized protein n=1 Tax=Oceanibacterium hippocampi TaxID=745714 RepID=A0A1Y5TSA4_9PROT|nr:hypothetical protein OCH7691_03105 [Oceanibacterium hippocampi]